MEYHFKSCENVLRFFLNESMKKVHEENKPAIDELHAKVTGILQAWVKSHNLIEGGVMPLVVRSDSEDEEIRKASYVVKEINRLLYPTNICFDELFTPVEISLFIALQIDSDRVWELCDEPLMIGQTKVDVLPYKKVPQLRKLFVDSWNKHDQLSPKCIKAFLEAVADFTERKIRTDDSADEAFSELSKAFGERYRNLMILLKNAELAEEDIYIATVQEPMII